MEEWPLTDMGPSLQQNLQYHRIGIKLNIPVSCPPSPEDNTHKSQPGE